MEPKKLRKAAQTLAVATAASAIICATWTAAEDTSSQELVTADQPAPTPGQPASTASHVKPADPTPLPVEGQPRQRDRDTLDSTPTSATSPAATSIPKNAEPITGPTGTTGSSAASTPTARHAETSQISDPIPLFSPQFDSFTSDQPIHSAQQHLDTPLPPLLAAGSAGPATQVTIPRLATSNHTIRVLLLKPRNMSVPSGANQTTVTERLSRATQYWTKATGNKITFSSPSFANGGSWKSSSRTCSELSLDVSGYPLEMQATERWRRVTHLRELAGFTTGTGKHLMVFSPNHECLGSRGSLGTSGLLGGGLSTVDLIPPPSDGRITSLRNSPSTSSIAHELGHNFGLRHNALWDCGSIPEGRLASDPGSSTSQGCRVLDYYDVSGPMGLALRIPYTYDKRPIPGGGYNLIPRLEDHLPPLNAVEAKNLKVRQERVGRVYANGTFTLVNRNNPTSQSTKWNALEIVDRANGHLYLLEYRAKSTGSWLGTTAWRDSPHFNASPSGFTDKPVDQVQIRRIVQSGPGKGKSLLIDPTPGAIADIPSFDHGLAAGQSYKVRLGDTTITVKGTSSTEASVHVQVIPPKAAYQVRPTQPDKNTTSGRKNAERTVAAKLEKSGTSGNKGSYRTTP